MRKHKKRSLIIALATIIYSALFLGGTLAYAAENETEPVSDQKYHFDNVVYAGDDDGFPDKGIIDEGNVHFGWKLGKFVVSGFTRVDAESSDVPVFLKNVGDEIKLSFLLEQNLNALNGDDSLTLNEDTGFDTYFGIEKTEFGKGTLIIRKTDYQNVVSSPQIYTDYLSGVSVGAETKVQLFEEGDYEVALDYSVLETKIKIATFEEDYRIFFKFKVRNGNCMVYPADVSTGQELTNASFTPNGFYLDLAKSRYLDIDISKQVMNAGKDGLVEDTRFNQPARDGEKFTDEGIYNIKVKNRYTGSETEKKIYVGNDVVLQAYVSNPGYSITQISNMIESGEAVNPDGTFAAAEAKASQIGAPETEEDTPTKSKKPIIIAVGVGAVVVVVVLSVLKKKRRRYW